MLGKNWNLPLGATGRPLPELAPLPQAPGSVRVAVERRGGEVVTSVSDSGPGIPPDVRARLFDLYATARYDDGGSGVGLATVKAIVDQLDGRVEVDTSDRGTTFRVILPEAAE